MAGILVKSEDINRTAGDICRSISLQLRRSNNFNSFLNRYTSEDLVNKFGMDKEDADIVKSAFADIEKILSSFESNRVFLDQLTGLGDI